MTGSSLAIWRGSPNHYNGRNGYTIDHITLHIMVGTLAGTDYCFQLASFMAASHYGVGSDGTIHQWVDEVNGSWADANMASDCSGITIEHAGGMAGIPVTAKEIEASAQLCADIARRYGWTRLWHDGLDGNVYLHREIPGTDHFGCPDNTINGLPVQQIIDRANQLLAGATTSTQEEPPMTSCMIRNDDNGTIWYWSPETGLTALNHPDQASMLEKAGTPLVHASATAPWWVRAQQITDLVQARTLAQEKAQTAALEALAKNMGANPSDITAAVRDAVNTALKDVSITLTNTGTNEAIDTKEAQ